MTPFVDPNRPRHEKWEIRAGFLAAIVGVCLAGWGAWLAGQANDRAAEAQSDLRAYVANATQDGVARDESNALNAYVACKRGNTQIRPGARVVASTLSDLIDTVVAAPQNAGQLPPSFVGAPKRLRRAIELLSDQPCERLYPEGYGVYRKRHPDRNP